MRFMMKKFVLALGLISLLGINGCFAEEQFVNPVFNKTLYAYSRTSWNTLLTPSSITQSPDNFSDSDAYIEKHSCELLENEFDHIKYKCNLCYQAFLEKEKTLKKSLLHPLTAFLEAFVRIVFSNSKYLRKISLFSSFKNCKEIYCFSKSVVSISNI